MEKIRALCAELDVRTAPHMMAGGRLLIVPLFAWYHRSFDTEPDIT
jgi:hypothetical protein